MNAILAQQRTRNATSRGAWDRYASHRQRVMSLLLRHGGDGSQRLCVLGAGNCNDLDLFRLARSFAQVHLVDLDEEALAFGLSRQRDLDSDTVHLHGGIDVTGIATELGAWCPERPADERDVARCVELAASAPSPRIPAPFDVLASVCLLSQLIDSVVFTLGERHPCFLDLMLAVRSRHLRLLVELLRPGGHLVLVTDIVSSASCPELPRVSEEQLPRTIARLIEERNFFTGVNPFVLQRYFLADSVVSRLVENVELARPWLWDFGPRTYAVCAICARRNSDELSESERATARPSAATKVV
jgi:hypothetical protein